jgi:hypothetical protein
MLAILRQGNITTPSISSRYGPFSFSYCRVRMLGYMNGYSSVREIKRVKGKSRMTGNVHCPHSS